MSRLEMFALGLLLGCIVIGMVVVNRARRDADEWKPSNAVVVLEHGATCPQGASCTSREALVSRNRNFGLVDSELFYGNTTDRSDATLVFFQKPSTSPPRCEPGWKCMWLYANEDGACMVAMSGEQFSAVTTFRRIKCVEEGQ